jgi:acetylornithine aminotransferase
VPPPGYLAAARAVTREHGALLVLDEIQTGIGRTGEWFAFQRDGVDPDVVTIAKGLGGGLPIGACIASGEAATLLRPGSHGSTFGGNPVAAAAAVAVLDTIDAENLLANVRAVGERLRAGIGGLAHPLVAGVRGIGLLLAVELTAPVALQAAAAALRAGFIVNPVAADAIRLAPPLILSAEQAQEFVTALPVILDDLRED